MSADTVWWVMLLVASVAAWEMSFQSSSHLHNPHTGGDILIQRTAQDIPFLTAQSESDLFYAQGHVTAQARLWQMEIFRRYMLGTLSEVFGNVTLQSDINHRRMGWVDICRANQANTGSTYLKHIRSYVSGVNDYLTQVKGNSSLVPPEFGRYDVPLPEAFGDLDVFLILKGLAVGLSGNANDEIPNQKIVQKTSLQRFIQLQARDPQMPNCLPPYHHSMYSPSNAKPSNPGCARPQSMDEWAQEHDQDPQPDWVMNTEEVAWQRLESRNDASELEKFLTSFASEPTRHASNNWAVAGHLTTTGKPILCNDPHLPYTAPMIWYLIGLTVNYPGSTPPGPWRNIIGASIVMAPGVGIGQTPDRAWGYTTDHADTQDVYLMKNTPDNKGYYYRGQVMTYNVTQSTIKIKGAPAVTQTFLRSVYGPVVVDGDDYYSVSFTGFNETDTSIEALMDSNTAQSMDEFRAAMSKWWSLLFNAAYVDSEGNILFQAVGAIPIRQKGDMGYLPKVGDGSQDWVGITLWDDMPRAINPADGFVVTANNPLGKLSQLSHPFEGTYVPGFRAQRIIDLLIDRRDQLSKKFDVDYMKQIQGDVTDLVFRYLYPALQNLALNNATDIQFQKELLQWDGAETLNSTMAPFFDGWLYCLYNVTFYEIGQSTHNPFLMSRWFNAASASGAGDDVSCSYWNQTCLEYASACFSQQVLRYGADQPTWGSIHHAAFLHLPPTPLRWNRVVPVGGSKYVPNAATFTLGLPGVIQELVVGGPSLRFIYDQSGEVPPLFMMPMGESGDPHSSHYDDLTTMWSQMEYLSLQWSTSA